MNIYDSTLWIKDIDRTIEHNPWIEAFSGKSILITGIGGLVCSAVADILIRYNELHDVPVLFLAAARAKNKIKKRFGEYAERQYFKFVEYDATKAECDIPFPVDYIIHGASNSSPDKITKEPVETMLSNIIGLHALLKYAYKNNVSRLLYISSSEVYGSKKGNELYKEGQYGYIDILNSRNSYSVSKRASETLCVSFADEYGVEAVIIRPGHIYGPTATINDQHVSSQWAYAAANGKNIIMKSNGMQLRSYCYCLDAATAILSVLIKGKNKHAYNISNPKSIINIKQMAEMFVKSAGVELKMELPTISDIKAFNPMSNSSLDSSNLIDLGWKCCFNAEEGFSHTVQILREIT